MASQIPAGAILRQLKADLIGKDSYRGVTLTYSWLANQFGHFALGFVPTLILFNFLSEHRPPVNAACRSAWIIWLVWIGFETYNFLGPLLSKRHSNSKLLFVPRKKYDFSPDWINVGFDTVTDLLFFGFGAFACARLCADGSCVKLMMIILVLALLIPARYWYVTKIFLQKAEYPFQFRISQWDLDISNADAGIALKFIASGETKEHLLIFGAGQSGKTSLGVGIATELSIKHHKVMYTTATNLYSLFFEKDPDPLPENTLWTWRTAPILVIDDINPGEPIERELVDADTVKKFINDPLPSIDNAEVLRNKKTIWVLGSLDKEKKALKEWCDMLDSIGVQKENIRYIDLSN